jgi:catechol 2,3-dioxygenase-like lactoylglutathione lyase family enzyme
MDMKLEVLVVPVSNVDRAKAFYEKLGFRLDIDYVTDEEFRVAQFTPPGSEASIIIGKGITSAAPGSLQNLHLVVSDIEEARADLLGRGIEVSEVFHDASGIFHHSGTEGRVAGRHPEPSDYGSFASFTDPDGNGWLLQEIKKQFPGGQQASCSRVRRPLYCWRRSRAPRPRTEFTRRNSGGLILTGLSGTPSICRAPWAMLGIGSRDLQPLRLDEN